MKLRTVEDAGGGRFRQIFNLGEPFPLDLINTVRHADCPARIYDVYGITEVR